MYASCGSHLACRLIARCEHPPASISLSQARAATAGPAAAAPIKGSRTPSPPAPPLCGAPLQYPNPKQGAPSTFQMVAVLLTGNGVPWQLFNSIWESLPFR